MADLYRSEGWRELARDLRIGGAELDLVVERLGHLRFVEVKAREPGDDLGFEAITADKRRRLGRAAEAFLQAYDDVVLEASFDVVVVRLGDDDGVERLEHAFDVPFGR